LGEKKSCFAPKGVAEYLLSSRRQKMREKIKTKEIILQELQELRKKTYALENAESARKQSEKFFNGSENRFRSIVENSHEGIAIVDDSFRLSYVNDELCRIFGYPKEEIIGEDFRKFLGKESKKLIVDRYLQRQSGEKVPRHYEAKIVRKDGCVRQVEIISAPIKGTKGNTEIVAQISDNTERKQTEEVLRENEKCFKELWENAPVGYHTLDTNGIITNVNQTEARMLGYSVEEMVGRSIFDFILPEQRAEARRRFKRKAAGKHVARAADRIYIKKDGSKLYVVIDDVFEKDNKGRIIGIRTTMVDITERKQMEEALQDSRERYKSLFDRSLYSVFIHDFEGNFLDANKAALDLLGYSKEEIPSLNISSLIDEEQIPTAIKTIGEIVRTGYQKKPNIFKLRKKDGGHVWVETEATIIYREGRPSAIQGIARDITNSMRVDQALHESQERYRTLAENAMDGIYVISPNGFEYVNPAFEKIFGYKTNEVCHEDFNFLDLIHPDDRELVLQRENGRKKGKELPPEYSFRILTKNKKIKHVEVSTVPLPGEKVRVLGILRDVTKRKQAEEALRDSEEKYKILVQTSPDAVTVTDLEGRITYVSRQTLELHGYKYEKELLGKSVFELISPQEHKRTMTNLQKTLKEGRLKNEEYTLLKKDGTVFTGELNCAVIKDAEGKPKMFIATTRDVTERKRTKEKIKESEERYKDLVEKAGVAILIDDKEGKVTYCNKQYADMFGYPLEEMRKQTIRSIVHPDDVEKVLKYHKGRVQSKKVPSRYECRGIKKDGSIIFIEIHADALIDNGDIIGTRSYIWDITERKRSEEAVRESEEKFKTLFNSAGDAIFITDLEGNILEVNQVACERLGFERKKILDMTLADINRPKQSASIPEKIEELSLRGHIFFETAHKGKNGTIVPIELSSRIIEYEGKPAALSIARDITERKVAEEERKQSFERLRRSLEETVNALASAVEMRDPYTAGHQHRVTSLACAIAEEMGLPKEKIEGIHMAGVIHDVGKIRVPAEILSWPGQLTEIDFNLIKTHPQVGYDILKRIELPHEVTKIMLQHHERLDGSGYPAGLKGDKILLEARILAVADVVEAMASHRPYRASLGIDKALEEISKNKGILYDPEVVDACLKLFNEKNFKFE
jgi:PAS domain S-box-containing protein/putative nucleotidyltransferase with HDIG domain